MATALFQPEETRDISIILVQTHMQKCFLYVTHNANGERWNLAMIPHRLGNKSGPLDRQSIQALPPFVLLSRSIIHNSQFSSTVVFFDNTVVG